MFSIFYLLNRINNFKCELLELKKNQRIISENIILPYILDNKIGFYHNSNFKKSGTSKSSNSSSGNSSIYYI